MRAGALFLVIPALVTAVLIASYELPVLRRDTRTEPQQLSWSEAVRTGNLEAAYRFVEAGEDPNREVEFSDDDLTGGQRLRVAPLLIAIARRDENMVMMLMSVGARLDAPGNRYAVCLAERLGAGGLATLLRRDTVPPPNGVCPDTPANSGAPLRGFGSPTS